MAGGLARLGDILGLGGIMIGNHSATVTVNNRPVALQGIMFTPHIPCNPKKPLHCFGTVFDFSGGVTIEGQIPITKGGLGTCGHGVMTASNDVLSLGGGGLIGMVIGAALGSVGSGPAFDISGTATGTFIGENFAILGDLERAGTIVQRTLTVANIVRAAT